MSYSVKAAPVRTAVAVAADQEVEAPPIVRHAPASQARAETVLSDRASGETDGHTSVAQIKKTAVDLMNAFLIEMRYLPPAPPPLVQKRALNMLLYYLEQQPADPTYTAVAAELNSRFDEFQEAHDFMVALEKNIANPTSIISKTRMFLSRIDSVIDKAQVSMFMPIAEATLSARMQRFERFLADDKWLPDEKRGVFAVHVDEENQQTIIQVGVAKYGPVYVTIPKVLRPDEVAQNSIRKLVGRLEPICSTVDPMAVIDGEHQVINYNRLFKQRRVIRAPSGDTDRLAVNVGITYARERLTPENTAIINSTPHDVEEHLAVFKGQRGRSADTWAPEAAQWDNTATVGGFSVTAEASREALLEALTQKQNVIVNVAHCDGKSMFMPKPPPEGTQITADYLMEHREAIAANKPFVYLFSCEAAKLVNAKDFASTLLECGAAGVVAAQTVLGAADGRPLLSRILRENREAPPIRDVWRTMADANYFEMEVFLA